jgi:hypothetical protein
MKRSVSPAPGAQFAGLRRRFERAQAGRADGDHPTASAACLGDGVHCRGGNLEALAVHPVLGQIADAHRLEGAGTDMQGQPGSTDTMLGEPLQQCGVEVQAGGWRCHGTGRAGKDGLVAFFVRRCGGVRDVRRQRQPPVALDPGSTGRRRRRVRVRRIRPARRCGRRRAREWSLRAGSGCRAWATCWHGSARRRGGRR